MNGSPYSAFYLTASISILAVAMLAWVSGNRLTGKGGEFPLARFVAGLIAIGIGGMSMMPPEYCFLAISLGILGGLTICRPAVGVATMLFFWMTRPWELGIELSLLPKLPRLWIVLIGIGLLYEKGIARDFWVRMKGHSWLWVIFSVWLSLTTLFATDKGESIAVLSGQLIPILVFLLLFSQVASDYRAVILGLTISCLSVGLVALGQALATQGLSAVITRRFTGIGMWANSNDVAAVLIVGVPMLMAAKGFPGTFAKIFKYFLVGTMVVLVFLTQSRAALLSLLFGFAVSQIKFKLTVARLAVIITVGVGCLGASSLFTRSESDLEGSSSARFNYAITGFKMLASNPIFGVGIGNYPIRFEEFTSDFSEYGQRTAHSSWVLVMAEAGIIGLLLFFRIYYLAVRDAWKVRQQHPELITALASYTVMMSTLSHTYLILPHVLFALASFAASEQDSLKVEAPPPRLSTTETPRTSATTSAPPEKSSLLLT